MKHYMAFLPLFTTLAGCGAGDRVAPWRAIVVDKRHVCFSVDNTDVLSRYHISSMQEGKFKTFASEEPVALSFPDSCLNLTLNPGYTYGVSYTLNGSNYRYVFFIDNDGNVSSNQ